MDDEINEEQMLEMLENFVFTAENNEQLTQRCVETLMKISATCVIGIQPSPNEMADYYCTGNPEAAISIASRVPDEVQDLCGLTEEKNVIYIVNDDDDDDEED